LNHSRAGNWSKTSKHCRRSVKDSSIVSVITMVELTKVYGMLAMSTYDYIGLGLMTAGIYFALSYPASLYAAWLERKLHHDHR
jgi:polar amino acid transport system substrate-binding protein